MLAARTKEGGMQQDLTTELTDLRQANERLRRKVEFLYDKLGLIYADEDVPLYVLHAQELIRASQYSDALRVIREHTAVGIVEARTIIVEMCARLGVQTPSEEQLQASTSRNLWTDDAVAAVLSNDSSVWG
jgi:hypothetical protein